jgi:hypothetical protein
MYYASVLSFLNSTAIGKLSFTSYCFMHILCSVCVCDRSVQTHVGYEEQIFLISVSVTKLLPFPCDYLVPYKPFYNAYNCFYKIMKILSGYDMMGSVLAAYKFQTLDDIWVTYF